MSKRSIVFAIIFGLVLLVSLPFIGVSQENPKSGGEIVLGLSQTLPGLNPLQEGGSYARYAYRQIFDPLVMLHPENREPVPYLAKSWEYSENGEEITFNLHSGVKFHNGAELTSEDVEFSLKWMMNPENPTDRKADVEWINDVKIIDKYTFKIVIKEEMAPYAPAIPTLATTLISIVPKNFGGLSQEEFNRNPIGSGPFKLEKWVQEDRLILSKNEDYWLKKPHLDKVIIRPIPELSTMMLELEKGGVDVTDRITNQQIEKFRKDKDVEVQQENAENFFWFGFNMQRSPFNNLKFREAVYMSINMDSTHQALKGNTSIRAYGIIPPTIFANDREFIKNHFAYEENDEKAKKYFEELEQQGVIGSNFSFKVYAPPDPVRIRFAEALVTNLKQNNIRAEVQSLEWGSYLDLLYRSEDNPDGEYGMYIVGWPGFPDPYYLLQRLFHSKNTAPGSPNFSLYKNQAVDLLIEAGNNTVDRDLRESYYKAAQRLIMADLPVIPAYHNLTTHGVRKRVHEKRVHTNYALVTPYRNVWVESK